MAVRPIRIEYKGTTYVLEYSRNSIKKMEASGFRVSDLTNMPATQIPLLFHGAFLMHHGGIRNELTDEILCTRKNKRALFERLSALYQEPLKAMIDDDSDEEESGNAGWEEI